MKEEKKVKNVVENKPKENDYIEENKQYNQINSKDKIENPQINEINKNKIIDTNIPELPYTSDINVNN